MNGKRLISNMKCRGFFACPYSLLSGYLLMKKNADAAVWIKSVIFSSCFSCYYIKNCWFHTELAETGREKVNACGSTFFVFSCINSSVCGELCSFVFVRARGKRVNSEKKLKKIAHFRRVDCISNCNATQI
jgi:hypothetical protein